MSLFDILASNPLIQRLGSALVHFLWQGLAIAVILSALLQLLRGRSPGVRYLTAWIALLGMAVSVPITVWIVASPTPPESAGTATEPSTMEWMTATAETGAGGTGPDRVDRRWNDEMAEMPLVPAAVESPAVGARQAPNDAPRSAGDIPSTNNTLAVRISQSMRPVLPWVVYGWLVGVFALSLWRLGGWIHLRRLCRCGTSPAPEAARQMLKHLLGRLQVGQVVQLLESTLVKVPTVVGWLRPVILLPAGILAEMPPQQLEMILAHELAHVRRHDFLLNLVQTAVETLLFYHPAVWWVSRRIRIEREACCDDLAAAAAGNRLLYARALTRLEELRHEAPSSARAGLDVAADGGSLPLRIHRLLGLPVHDPDRPRAWLISSVAVLLLIGVLAGYLAVANEPERNQQPPSAGESAVQSEENPKEPTGGNPLAIEIPAEEPAGTGQVQAWPADDPRSGAKVELVLDKKEYFLGENVLLHYGVTNRGEEPFEVGFGGDSRSFPPRALRFKVVATDENGRPVDDPYPSVMNWGGPGGERTLKPGEAFWASLPLMLYCDFDKPGVYKIRVYHDLGWDNRIPFQNMLVNELPKGPHQAPIVETTIKLMLPTPEQARRVVAQTLALPTSLTASFGKRAPPRQDVTVLRHPVYLPIVEELARQGSQPGATAVGSIPTPEATRALIRLLDCPDRDVAAKSLELLLRRLPLSDLDKRNTFWANQQRLARRSWRDEMQPAVVEVGWKLLAKKDRPSLITGARILECLGRVSDFPRFMKELDRVLEEMKDDPTEQNAYPRPANASGSMIRAGWQLIERGAAVPTDPRTPGQAALFMTALGRRADFRPADWQATAGELLKHPIPYVRSVTLENLRNVPLGPLGEAVTALLSDEHLAVSIPACELAATTKAERYREPLLEVLRTADDQWLMQSAHRAALACGADRDRVLEICIDQLGRPRGADSSLYPWILALMIEVVEREGGYGHSNTDWSSAGNLAARWRRLLEANREQIRAGKLFKIGKPPLKPNLFPRGFQFQRKNNPPWPDWSSNAAESKVVPDETDVAGKKVISSAEPSDPEPSLGGESTAQLTVASDEEETPEELSEDKDRVAQLIKQLGDDDFGRREAAQRELIQIGAPARTALQAALGHADIEVASRAKRCLAEIYPKSLIAALRGDDDSTWTAAVTALATLGEPAVEELIAALEDKDPRVRRGAVQALGHIKDARVIDPLIKMLNDPEATIRTDAADGLGYLASHNTQNLRPARLVPALAAAVKDKDRKVRAAAAWALGYANDARAVEPLLGALRDEHPGVQWRAAQGLGYLRAKVAVEPLMSALRSDDKTVRRNAAAALGRIGDRRPLPRLSALAANDEHADVRAAAGEALRIIEHPQPRLSPIAWGKPVDGLQAGLRCTSGMAPYGYGQIVRYELLVRNLGQRDRTVQWESFGTRWHPIVKDGKVPLHGLIIDGRLKTLTRKIPAGRPESIETMACTVRPSDWKKHDFPPSLRVAPGGYEVSTTFVSSQHDPKLKDVWQGKLCTGEVELVVAASKTEGKEDSAKRAAATSETALPGKVVDDATGKPVGDDDRIAQLIEQLGDDTYERREAAQRELIRIGRPARAALEAARKNADAQVASRAKSCLAEIDRQLAERQAEHRRLAAEAVKRSDRPAATRHYRALLEMPEPPLCDCKAASKFFEAGRAFESIAIAMEARAKEMKRIIHTPVEQFIRPAPPQEPGAHVEGGPTVLVQTQLDGIWVKGKGGAFNENSWVNWLTRKQDSMKLDRLNLLVKLGRLYRDTFGRPKQAVAALAEAMYDVEFFTDPIDKVIARDWPIRSGEHKEIHGPVGGSYVNTLRELSEMQQLAGDLDGAIETKTRELLAHFILCWGHRQKVSNRPARELASLLRRLPANAPLPPLFWINVLEPENRMVTLDLEKDRPLELHDLNVLARPGYVFDSLEVTADMEGLGGRRGEVSCYTVFEKHTVLGRLRWHSDGRKGREEITEKFKIPPEAKLIRFETEPWRLEGLRVHRVTVKATFRPRAGEPAEKEATAERGAKHAEIRLEGRWPDGKTVDGAGRRFGISGSVYVFDPADPKLNKFVRTPASCPGLKVLGLEFISRKGYPRVDVAFGFQDGKTVGAGLFELTVLDKDNKVLERQRALELRNRELPVEVGRVGELGGTDPPSRSGKAELRFPKVALTDVSSYRLRVVEAEIPLLVELLEEPDVDVRECAARALGQWGVAAEASLPELQKLSQDEQERVRSAAKQAVQRIRKAAEDNHTAWGEAVEGVQVRLRAAKRMGNEGETVTLLTEARNNGERWLHLPKDGRHCQVEVDEKWYEWVDPRLLKESLLKESKDADEPYVSMSTELLAFESGKAHTNLTVSIPANWRRIPDGKEVEYGARSFSHAITAGLYQTPPPSLLLAPGKHRIRVAYICSPSRAAAPHTNVRAISNPVEIEILAGSIQWGRTTSGLQAGLAFDLQAFRQQRELGERATDFDAKLRHFRNALTWQSDHPERVALEYQVAVMLKESYDSRTQTWPRREEALAMFRHIVDSYDHMSYYTTVGAGGRWEAQVAVPNAAVRAASLLSVQGGDQKEVRQYLSRALDTMNQTCRRRIREWSTAPREPPPDPFEGLLEQSKWQSRVAEWERRKEAAAKGEVLSAGELETVKLSVPSIGQSRGGWETPEVLARLRQIAETYRGTPIARIAQQRLEAAKGDPGVLLRELNAGELSDEKIRQITGKVLALQADLKQPWDGAWGNWLETARVMGKVSDVDFTRYAKQSNPTWQIEVNQALDDDSGRFGLSFRYKHVGGRVASVTTNHNLIIKYRLVRLRLGDLPLDVGGPSGGERSLVAWTQPGGGFFREPSEIDGLEKLKPGKYEAVLELEATIHEAGHPDKILHRCESKIKDEVELTELLFNSASEDGTWGPAVEGVQVRLRCDRPQWQVDETITWRIDARNTGKRHLKFTPHAYETVKIDVDGRVFNLPSSRGRVKPYELKPGQEHRDISFSVSRRQQLKDHPFELMPGKHTVKITVAVHPAQGEAGEGLQVSSNPVEIEIVAGQSVAWGTVAAGLQAGVRLLEQTPRVHVGEQPPLQCIVRNVSERPIQFTTSEPGLRAPLVRRADGTRVDVEGPLFDGPVRTVQHVLESGKSVALDVLGCAFCPDHPIYRSGGLTARASTGPGVYKLSCELALTKLQDADWEGRLETGQLDLEVLSPDPDDLTRRVTSLLKEGTDRFTLKTVYLGDQEKPLRSLRLTTNEPTEGHPAHWTTVRIDRNQAEAIIDHLGAAGYLWPAAAEPQKQEALSKPSYFFVVSIGNESEPSRLTDLPPISLGWGLEMLPRLEALRKVFDGDAAKAMDELLAALAPNRKQWEAAAAGGSSTSSSSVPQWGPAVEGVQVRLRPDKTAWKHGTVPSFAADVRNRGTRDLYVYQVQGLCELEVDGNWYQWAEEIDAQGPPFPPGRQYDGIPVTLVSSWHGKKANRPLEVTIGKHTVRVAFIPDPMEKDGKPVRAVSNPVEIEIVAPPLLKFGPVWDRTVHDVQSGRECFIDFDTGQVMSWPADGLPPFDPKQGVTEGLKRFMRTNGLDAIGWLPREAPMFEGLLGLDMKVVEVADTRWFIAVNPAGVRGPLSRIRSLGDTVPISQKNVSPPSERSSKSFLFQTREGAQGKLRLNVIIEGAHVELSYQRVWKPEELEPWSGPSATRLRLRLRPNAPRWAMGQTPELTLDLWNDNHRDSPIGYVGLQEAECQLEYDGQWYRWANPVAIYVPVRMLKAARAHMGAVKISLVRSWARTDRPFTGEADDAKRLRLTPGKHTVRVRFTAGYLRDADKKAQVVSKPVEIVIAADDEQPDQAVRGRVLDDAAVANPGEMAIDHLARASMISTDTSF